MADDSSKTEESTQSKARRRLTRRLVRWARVLVMAYVGWCLLLFLIQDWLLYPSAVAPSAAARFPIGGAQSIERRLENGERVEAYFVPAPSAAADAPGPVVIFFHGNAQTIDIQQVIVDGYHRMGVSVLLCEYRGYGRSGGVPSRIAIRSDAIYFYDELTQRPDVDPTQIVFHGHSLGGAVAAGLAAHRKPAALILQSTFTNMGAIAHRLLVPGFIARNRYDTAAVVSSIDVPVLVLHGTHDVVIPARQGRAMGKMGTRTTYFEWPCGHGHIANGPFADAYWSQIQSFLSKAGIRKAGN